MKSSSSSPAIPCELAHNYYHITEENAKASPLFRLPAEIRDRIYKHALSGCIIAVPAPQCLNKPSWTPAPNPPTLPITAASKPPAVLATCAQLRFESEPIFYENCMFDLSDPDITNYSLAVQALGQHHAQCIQIIKVQAPNAWARLYWLRQVYDGTPRTRSYYAGILPSLKRVDIDTKSLPWGTMKMPSDQQEMRDVLRLTFDRADLEVRTYERHCRVLGYDMQQVEYDVTTVYGKLVIEAL